MQAENLRTTDNLRLPDGRGKAQSDCGDAIIFTVYITDEILEVRLDATGCQYTILCARAASLLAKGKTLAQARRDTTPEAIIAAIENLPVHNHHCAHLASQALTEALTEAARTFRDPWRKLYRPRG